MGGIRSKAMGICHGALLLLMFTSALATEETRVVLESDGWQLVGDLRLPDADHPIPAVLLLNKAAGDRGVYTGMASELAERGIGSLRLDLRGHGESTNLDRFVPGETDSVARENMIWGADADVVRACQMLQEHPAIDGNRIGVVGASYSGEEAVEAGRSWDFARAYVLLSPGSLSDESIALMDSVSTSWLFVACRQERYLQEITALVESRTRNVELLLLPGQEHATRLLDAHPDLAERIAIWLAWKLSD